MTDQDNVDRAFSGYGMALRREGEAPIPGEPLMSIEDAKRITRELLAASAYVQIDRWMAEQRIAVDHLLNTYETRCQSLQRLLARALVYVARAESDMDNVALDIMTEARALSGKAGHD